MGLKEYKQKRNFEETEEPEGAVKKTGRGALRFVVQKHDASRLHYDFRLEMDGVLKSWAVPKGPSLDPSVKRLAMMVEDHPLSYRDFEGIIPQGNYGGGTVIVWDEGTYHLPGVETRKENDKEAQKHIKDGSIHIIMEGKKLKGEFMLFKFEKGGENAWLLAKKDDKYASTEDITEEERSVKTNRTLDEVEEQES